MVRRLSHEVTAGRRGADVQATLRCPVLNPAARAPDLLVDQQPGRRQSGRGAAARVLPGSSAPRADDVLPAAFAAVRNAPGGVLLVRRIDDGNWELPGGRIEVGESAGETLVREVAEESGITIGLTGLAGVYSDPTHVLVDPDDSIHQQLALCFHAVPAPAQPRSFPAPTISRPSTRPGSTPPRLRHLMHPAMRLRLDDAVTEPDLAHCR